MKVKPDALYLGDNGRCCCGEHLGTTARLTGRDLSGQPIEEITPDMLPECAALGFTPKCEEPRCGKAVSALWRVAS